MATNRLDEVLPDRESEQATQAIEGETPQGDILGGEGLPGVNLFWGILWVLFRVALVLLLWLGLFVAVFLGFFTIPLVLVLSLFLGYALYRLVLRLWKLAQKHERSQGQ